MLTNYQQSKQTLEEVPYYQECMRKTIADFPPLDCPQHYKEAICALSGGVRLLEYINEPLGALANRSILEVLKAKDYAAIEQYVFQCVALDTAGPGSY